MLGTSTRTALSFCTALAVHAPVLWATPPVSPSAASARVAALSFEVRVLPPVISSVAPAAAPLPLPSNEVARSRRVSRRVKPGAADSAPAAIAPAPVEPLQPAVGTEPLEPAPVQRDLSPLTAARSMSLDLPAGSPARAPVEASAERHEEARLAEGIPGLTRNRRVRDRSAGELAQDVQGAVLRPWDLVFQPLRDGRYRYRGQGFDAVILADGSIKYRNKDGPRLSVGLRQDLKETKGKRGQRNPQAPVLGLDLGDPRGWIDKIAGNDSNAAERRTFLQRTRALREYLREQAERGAREAHGGAEEP